MPWATLSWLKKKIRFTHRSVIEKFNYLRPRLLPSRRVRKAHDDTFERGKYDSHQTTTLTQRDRTLHAALSACSWYLYFSPLNACLALLRSRFFACRSAIMRSCRWISSLSLASSSSSFCSKDWLVPSICRWTSIGLCQVLFLMSHKLVAFAFEPDAETEIQRILRLPECQARCRLQTKRICHSWVVRWEQNSMDDAQRCATYGRSGIR